MKRLTQLQLWKIRRFWNEHKTLHRIVIVLLIIPFCLLCSLPAAAKGAFQEICYSMEWIKDLWARSDEPYGKWIEEELTRRAGEGEMKTERQARMSICGLGQSNPETAIKCSGPDCMMWRWAKDPVTEELIMAKTDEKWSCVHCNGTGKHDTFMDENNPEGWCPECEGKGRGFVHAAIGYCGLAGVPR